jgi:hypothetical protein
MDRSAASRSGRFIRGKRTLGTHWELESSRTAPEDLKQKQKSLPLSGNKYNSSIVPVV